MSIAAGGRLGPYEILSPLGAGGMGEVYRARDDRLGRSVAIKVLPAELTSDKGRLQRFEKEARAASSMNHPNIVTIHEVEQAGSTSFIVMELVEGKTLREVIASGPLPVPTLLGIGVQIAEGLARAHASGIVHRDLKPENVMVTKEGLVKILDFGLAKLAHAEADGGQPVDSPTVTQTTGPGIVMGTVGYMSPEQASGHPVDFRSDQFSLGSILHEMATGKQPFKRGTAAQTLAAIIQEEPEPIAALNSHVPAPVRWIVERCMAKEPRLRYASSEDLARELAMVRDHLLEFSSGEMAGIAPQGSRLRRRELIAWAAATLIAAAATALLIRRPAATQQPRRHVYLLPLAGTELTYRGAALAVSPDGKHIAFTAHDAEGKGLLFLRTLAEAEAHPLPGTEDALWPFWSPDSRAVAFFTYPGGELKRIGISQSQVQVLCEAPDPHAGSWGADDVILFGNGNGPLYRVSASGGKPTVATRLAAVRGEVTHMAPHFLPDGRRFLFLATLGTGDPPALEAGSLDSTDAKLLGKVESTVAYAPPGYLLSVTAGHTLVAQPFDADSLCFLGDRFPIAERVSLWGRYSAAFSVSRTGVLAYETLGEGEPRRFVWFDRSGRQLESFGTPRYYGGSELSPDGTRLVTPARDPRTRNWNLWLTDLSRGVTTRFTFDPGSTDLNARWSPDGRQLAFTSNRGGPDHGDLYIKSAGGTTPETLLFESDGNKFPNHWSPDGRYLLYSEFSTPTSHIWALPMAGDHTPFRVTQNPSNEEQARFSPDGHLIAYISDESGRYEAYVQAFPRATERWQISNGGAHRLRWRKDGKEFFFVSADNQIMSVEIQTRPVFKASLPRPLFSSPPCVSADADCVNTLYEVTPDGQRFLFPISEHEAPKAPIDLVFNWLPENER